MIYDTFLKVEKGWLFFLTANRYTLNTRHKPLDTRPNIRLVLLNKKPCVVDTQILLRGCSRSHLSCSLLPNKFIRGMNGIFQSLSAFHPKRVQALL